MEALMNFGQHLGCVMIVLGLGQFLTPIFVCDLEDIHKYGKMYFIKHAILCIFFCTVIIHFLEWLLH